MDSVQNVHIQLVSDDLPMVDSIVYDLHASQCYLEWVESYLDHGIGAGREYASAVADLECKDLNACSSYDRNRWSPEKRS